MHHLSWEEVQALTGPGTVGLPLGYKPDAQQKLLGKPAVPAAVRSAGILGRAAGDAQELELLQLTRVAAGDEAGGVAGEGGAHAGPQISSLQEGLQVDVADAFVLMDAVSAKRSSCAGPGWRCRGWQRSQYMGAGSSA
ncbi:hypothetical protein COO60DRAFT_1641133 [Scenedesmus sp. NREL 46B-D3]|nr:hypothetical protein COO60DRAFT_1641133 [Scenedesmus sp. NREL 46B-D3]